MAKKNEEYKELLIGAGSEHTKRLRLEKLGDTEDWRNLTTLDINKDHNPDIIHDLTVHPLPFDDNTFDEIHAYEVLEHLRQQGDSKGFFADFSEFWRILKPKGRLYVTVPSRMSEWALGDPDHKRIVQKESLIFLDQEEYKKQIGKTAMSDFRYIWKGDFKRLAMGENTRMMPGTTYFVIEAVKPSRIEEQYK